MLSLPKNLKKKSEQFSILSVAPIKVSPGKTNKTTKQLESSHFSSNCSIEQIELKSKQHGTDNSTRASYLGKNILAAKSVPSPAKLQKNNDLGLLAKDNSDGID